MFGTTTYRRETSVRSYSHSHGSSVMVWAFSRSSLYESQATETISYVGSGMAQYVSCILVQGGSSKTNALRIAMDK